MNKYNQVSLGNGANFSNIRKLSNGDKLGGITYNPGTSWYDTIFSAFKQEMMKDLSAAKTKEEKQAVVDKYNSQLSAYAKLRPLFPNLSQVQFNEAVKAYQNSINEQFGFVNNKGINNGVTSNRYKKEGSETRINKDVAPNWESEGYWAGQTQDRTTLGYKGDWDENSNTFRNWQLELNKLGLETFLDKDNAYKLRLIQEPDEPEITPEKKKFDVLKYNSKPSKLTKFKFPTFPLYNAALLGVANATNKRILDAQLKAPVMKYEAPYLQGKVTDAYSERAANEQALQEYNWAVQQQLNNSSDLGLRHKAERDLRAQRLNVALLNNKEKQNEFNQTSKELQQISNTNKLNEANTANLNRQAYVADTQRKLNAISQYFAQRGQNIQDNIMSNYTDWKSWNRNNALQDYADWQSKEYEKVQADLKEAQRRYQDSTDITKFKGYDDFWKSHMIGDNPDLSAFGTKYGKYLVSLGENVDAWDQAIREKFFKEHMNDEDLQNEMGPIKEEFAKYQIDSARNFATALQDIRDNWNITRDKNNIINYDGEISPWLYYKLNPRTSYERYKFSYKKGGRFLEYLEHNRKAEKDIRDVTVKTMQNSKKLLARDLDALDRESLLLLRAIFK